MEGRVLSSPSGSWPRPVAGSNSYAQAPRDAGIELAGDAARFAQVSPASSSAIAQQQRADNEPLRTGGGERQQADHGKVNATVPARPAGGRACASASRPRRARPGPRRRRGAARTSKAAQLPRRRALPQARAGAQANDTPTINRKNGNTRSVGVQPCQAAWSNAHTRAPRAGVVDKQHGRHGQIRAGRRWSPVGLPRMGMLSNGAVVARRRPRPVTMKRFTCRRSRMRQSKPQTYPCAEAAPVQMLCHRHNPAGLKVRGCMVFGACPLAMATQLRTSAVAA